jgi:hypothetical protein
MPRFYFHISNGQGFIEDEEGIELTDEAAARSNAVAAARDVMAGDLREGLLDLACSSRSRTRPTGCCSPSPSPRP